MSFVRSSKRRIQLGIDYGTSASKLAFRDMDAPGGDEAFLIEIEGSHRIPSTMACAGADILMGWQATRSSASATLFESVKMRVGEQVKPDRTFCFSARPPFPPHFDAIDFATLMVWRLITVGVHRVREYLGGNQDFPGMTMGIPMSFFRDRELRLAFLLVARRAWWLFGKYRPLDRDFISLEEARRALDAATAALQSAQEDDIEVTRRWLRSEAEAAMWWPFYSAAVPAGPYAKLDVGAGTTNASVLRKVNLPQNGQFVPRKVAFFGAHSEPAGMDSIDHAIAREMGGVYTTEQIRGDENRHLQDPVIADRCYNDLLKVHRAMREAWHQGFGKYRDCRAERDAWNRAQVFMLGGGSLVNELRKIAGRHPRNRDMQLQLLPLHCPDDFFLNGRRPIPREVLPFILVAYGLTTIGAIPEVTHPDDIEAIPTVPDLIRRFEWQDNYWDNR